MELSEVLRKRRMVRAYDPDRPVLAEDLDAVCAAALRSPSAGFTQAVSLLILQTGTDRTRFWQLTGAGRGAWGRGMRTAPVLILVWTSEQAYLDRYAEPDKGWTDRDSGRWSAPYWYVDGGMAAMAALLTAVDRGLGACFFGIPVDRIDAIRSAYAVPTDELSVGVISLGYAVPAPAIGSPTRRPRTAPERLIHRGIWQET